MRPMSDFGEWWISHLTTSYTRPGQPASHPQLYLTSLGIKLRLVVLNFGPGGFKCGPSPKLLALACLIPSTQWSPPQWRGVECVSCFSINYQSKWLQLLFSFKIHICPVSFCMLDIECAFLLLFSGFSLFHRDLQKIVPTRSWCSGYEKRRNWRRCMSSVLFYDCAFVDCIISSY